MSKAKLIRLIILALVFFVIANTIYFWIPVIEAWGLLALPLLGLFYILIAAFFVRNLILLFKENFRDRRRRIASVILFTALFLTFFRIAFIDFEKFAGKNLLVASRESVADCMTILKLKDNNTFIEESLCFGVSHLKGTWTIKGDTILFNTVEPNRRKDKYYMYGVIRKNSMQDQKMVQHIIGTLDLYKEKKDTADYNLYITKNDFPLQ